LLQAERRDAVADDLAAVDSGGRVVAAAPATSLPLAQAGPVRAALAGRASTGIVEASGTAVLVGSAPIRLGDQVVGATVALQRVDDAFLNNLTRDLGLSAAILAPGRLVAATTAWRARYNGSSNHALRLDPPSDGQPGQLALAGATYDVVSQTLPAKDGGRDLTLVVGGPSGGGAPTLPRLDLASAIVAALLAAFVGWLLGRKVGASALALAQGVRTPPAIAGAELAVLAARLAEERSQARSREAADEAEAHRLRAILDALSEGIIVSDGERRVVLANLAARSLLGLNGAAEPGAVIPFLPQSEGAAEIRANARVLRSYSAPIAPEPDGTRGMVTVLRDATAERESDRLRGEFLSIVSHELQTPLTAIAGAADLLLDESDGLTPEHARFLTTIRRNADRLVGLVSDLLDVSRLEAGRIELDPQAVDLGTVVRATLRSMGHLFEAKNQSAVVDLTGPDGAPVPPVLGDRRRLEQVLANLLGNASQYTQAGGRIAVGLRWSDEEVVLSVADDGPGIAPADLPHVFETFYRGSSATNRRERGSGLGLAIVRSLVELHGGRVWAESGGTTGPEPGTRINVALPVAREEE
jgi:signal transduction histidine kinase